MMLSFVVFYIWCYQYLLLFTRYIFATFSLLQFFFSFSSSFLVFYFLRISLVRSLRMGYLLLSSGVSSTRISDRPTDLFPFLLHKKYQVYYRKLKYTPAVRSKISSKLIFASCVICRMNGAHLGLLREKMNDRNDDH